MAKKPPAKAAPKFERIKFSSREEWLALRQKDVTASAAPALLGIHKYQSARGLYEEKRGEKRSEEENDAMRRGRVLEPIALQILQEDHPRIKFWQPSIYCRDPSARLGATADIFAMHPEDGFGVVQVKSVHPMVFRTDWHVGEDDDDEFTPKTLSPPLWVMTQGLIDAHISSDEDGNRAQWAAVAPVVVDFGIRCPLIRIDLKAKGAQGVIQNIYDATADFWDSVKKGIPPEFDYALDGARIAALYDAPKAATKDLSKDNRIGAALEEYAAAAQREKEAKALKKVLRAEIMAKLDGHEIGYVPGWNLTCKVQDRDGYTVKPTSFPVLRAGKRGG